MPINYINKCKRLVAWRQLKPEQQCMINIQCMKTTMSIPTDVEFIKNHVG